MNPCESSPITTAPYYREARVIACLDGKTACGMRHCCARRIVYWRLALDGTRITAHFYKMGRAAPAGERNAASVKRASEPPTAAQQRIIGAAREANRIAVPTRLCRARPSASPFRRHRSHSSPRLPINPFLLGERRVKNGDILFPRKENIPFHLPARYGVPLPFREQKRKNKTYLAAGSIFRSYSPSSTARRSLTLPSSASSIVWISASRSRLSVPPRGR